MSFRPAISAWQPTMRRAIDSLPSDLPDVLRHVLEPGIESFRTIARVTATADEFGALLAPAFPSDAVGARLS